MQKSKLHSLQAEPGYIAHRYDPNLNRTYVLYDGRIADLDTSEGRWAVYCVEHGTFVYETNQRRARKLMKEPEKWCDGCMLEREEIEATRTKTKIVPYNMKRPEEQARELKLMAKMVKGNPEKAALFEKVYGVKPDSFWD